MHTGYRVGPKRIKPEPEITYIEERGLGRYLTEIREGYKISPIKKREFIASVLEKIANVLSFDPEKARQIRIKAGLTQEELGRKITTTTTVHGQIFLAKLERGARLPAKCHKPRGICRKYLNWLKKQGYNPYKL